MKVIILMIVILISCSKQETTTVTRGSTFQNADYIIMADNEAVEFDSKIVRVAEIEGGYLTYSIGLVNNYNKDKSGGLRDGNHPESEFRVQIANYKIHKNGDKVRLEFISSSCKNSNTNPFDSILPSTEITMLQLQDSLNIKTSTSEEEVLYKAESGDIETLWGENVSRILCGDEVND